MSDNEKNLCEIECTTCNEQGKKKAYKGFECVTCGGFIEHIYLGTMCCSCYQWICDDCPHRRFPYLYGIENDVFCQSCGEAIA